ncbi:hypothetical protein L484_011546 [Morus notabilis]|uniref:Uncharacterized protein n=1 Tax=Morus notabilis TaxID=981085 RepID=W9RDF8_9ROSA|nr:uncharacterized protein LOC21394798 isoform X1 [Morus notabilis]EXB83252.1 hypothetical protein L484_011546 [Morus notabilis]
MAKSMRCKREKRLRAIRRDMVEPFYENKDAAKLAALEAAMNAPKLPVKQTTTTSSSAMEAAEPTSAANGMDIEMADDNNQNKGSLKPTGGVGKSSKRQFKVGKGKRHGKGKGKGKLKRRHI